MNKMHIVSIGAIFGPSRLVPENAASGGVIGVWLVNNHFGSDTYWTVY